MGFWKGPHLAEWGYANYAVFPSTIAVGRTKDGKEVMPNRAKGNCGEVTTQLDDEIRMFVGV